MLLDQAMHRRLVSCRALIDWAAAHSRMRGVMHIRKAIALSDPASESPMETRLRVLLLLAGLTRPRSQVSLHDAAGHFVGRPDLNYGDQRLAIEYDGGMHRVRLASDNQRQNRLIDAGYRLLRFTATDLLSNPDSVVELVRRQIRR
jgi:very-short-patch-repair endonuclease